MADIAPSQSSSSSQDNTETVAKHYNELKEAGLGARTNSRIFYLRNFNNWIKSMAIAEYLGKVKEIPGYHGQITALDLCSGKGGDLLKWSKGGIHKLVCADIAGTSVEQCRERYSTQRNNSYEAEFITADCTKVRLKDQYKDSNLKFNLVSCQFSFHYSFESQPQAEMMLRNACECLKVGGYFIGTTPNAYEIIKRLRNSDGSFFGNDVFSITSRKNYKEDTPDLFGACYDFHLEGVVDCPEFLVYMPLLEEMAKKYGMRLERVVPFADYFQEKLEGGRGLLQRMQALEPYPPQFGAELVGKDPEDYEVAKAKLAEDEPRHHGGRRRILGTLSKAEWEATTIYVLFAFKKVEEMCPELLSQPAPETDTCSPPKRRKTDNADSTSQESQDTAVSSSNS